MNAHSVIEDWERAPFDGGFEGLATLASSGFDGAVEAAGTWLFLRDGEPIAVVSELDSTPIPGDIDAFEDASGSQHEAPTSAAATLAAMFALDGEVRGEYFTDDTPLSAVHDTLSGGGFTGYVELSENVLSGDYYYVYVDGEVDHVGFVGSSQRLYGEEALTKAENEIGIYAVVSVSLSDLEIPEPEPEQEPDPEPEPDPTAVPDSGSDPNPDEEAEPESKSESKPEPKPEPEQDLGSDSPAEASASSADGGSDDAADAGADAGAETSVGTTRDPGADGTASNANAGDRRRNGREDGPETGSDDERTVDPSPDPYPGASPADPSEGTGLSSSDPDPDPDADASDSTGIGSLTTRRVPSLDPEQSGRATPDEADDDWQTAAGDRTVRRTASETIERSSDVKPGARANEAEGSSKAYRERIDEYETRIDELESELEASESRIESLEAELETTRTERDELQARIDELGAEVSSAPGSSLTAEEAISGTSLFVREHTRGEATLEDAHRGLEDRKTVAENLHIGYHTTFDSSDVTVEAEPFETWLRSSAPYEFAEWLVTDLLFEIRSTGAKEGLRPLYDALPAIDRVGFDETIEIGSTTDDEAEPETVHFDIVARNKKGEPLVVAHFDQRREPTRADTVGPFVTASSNVSEANGTLAAGFIVTSSYFEADAMSATEEATSSSFLSRSKRRSYVKLSRSSGYHLCLVEARDETFTLTVPEL